MKTHLHDVEHEAKIPDWDENKINGYRATCCGYQRKLVTSDRREVTCKICLREIERRRKVNASRPEGLS